MPVELAIHSSANTLQAVTVISSLVATCNGTTVITQSRYFTAHRPDKTPTTEPARYQNWFPVDGTAGMHTYHRTADYTEHFNIHVPTYQQSKIIAALCGTFPALVGSNMEIPASCTCRQRWHSMLALTNWLYAAHKFQKLHKRQSAISRHQERTQLQKLCTTRRRHAKKKYTKSRHASFADLGNGSLAQDKDILARRRSAKTMH